MAGDPFHKYAGTLVRRVEKRSERRKIPRYAVNADSEVEEPKVRAKINGRMTDLGLGGCYVDAIMTFPVDTAVHMRMTREGFEFRGGREGRVLQARTWDGTGVYGIDV